jgi:ubiquinone/menaquinone biosynthesis C-methylase UbiE
VPTFRKFAHYLIFTAKLSQGKIVLDVGTGTGIAAMEAALQIKPGGIVLAIDRSKAMIRFAERNATKCKIRNIAFFDMDATRMLFPNELFDVALSNCGVTSAAFPKAVSEVFRVLRKGGLFVLDDWHLKDVGPHRNFGEVLQRYRTDSPSRKLRVERMALATYERAGSRYMNLNELVKELERVGFVAIRTLHRNHKIQLGSVQAFLDMRLKREALKHELRELSPTKRRLMNNELRRQLKPLVRNGRFIFDWPVTYVSARKPN